MKINHSTVQCPNCEKDSYKSIMDIIEGDNKCIWCNSELTNERRDEK